MPANPARVQRNGDEEQAQQRGIRGGQGAEEIMPDIWLIREFHQRCPSTIRWRRLLTVRSLIAGGRARADWIAAR